MMSDLAGQQLGNCRLLRLLWAGSSADVYLGEHLILNKQIAVKVSKTHLTTNEVAIDFFNHARILASLDHHNILPVVDVGVEHNTPFLAMEYVSFNTLRQLYPKSTPLSLNTILSYVIQIASALQYAHGRNVLHRNLKPENIFHGYKNDILLSDFGIAYITQSQPYHGMEVIGTVNYMPPEQLQGRAIPASDQYALGVVIYEWLSGSCPFQGSFAEVANQQLFINPPSLRQNVPSISADVEEVVMMALAKDPQRRFRSVQAFVTAFEQACQAEFPTYVTSDPTYPAATPPQMDQAAQAQYINAIHSYNQSQIPKQRSSRRTFLIAGLGIVGGAGVAALALSRIYPLLVFGKNTATPTAHITSIPTINNPSPVITVSPESTPTSSPFPPLGTLQYTYRGHTGIVYADVWSPAGNSIASCGQDKTVQVWNVVSGNNMLTYHGHPGVIYALSWSTDGRYIVSGGDGAAPSYNNPPVLVWDAATGITVYTYTGHTKPVFSVVFSPHGTRIASGGADNTVQVWDATTGFNVLTFTRHSDKVRGIAWSPDGKSIASASEDRSILLWDANSGNVFATCSGHTDGVLFVDWSPDGRHIASGSRDATARTWDASNGTNLLTYHGHSSRVWSVSWSPDGKSIASAGHDATVQIWDATTSNTIYTYRKHTANIWDAPWSPNGQHIASASDDGTVQVWQAV